MILNKLIPKAVCMITAAVVFILNTAAISADAFNFTPVKGKDEDNNYIRLELNSESVYMINMDTGEVLIDIESKKQRVPASITKIMTAIVLLDEFEGDEQRLKSTKYSAGSEAFDELYGTGASTADIQPYEEVSCYDLLAALMIPSACEAANIIAVGMCGSIDAFVEKMNAKAAELGMDDSHFSNAHGLSGDNNYTTCEDIAKMCMYALDKYDVFADIVAMYDYVLAPTEFHPEGTYIFNTNYMLSIDSPYYYSYCRGIKTGTLDLSGRCLASYSVYDGKRYLIVTLGAPLDKKEEDYEKGYSHPLSVYAYDTVYYNLIDHINLYEWAFDYIEDREIVDKNSEIREAKVEFGEDGRDYVTLKPESGYSISMPAYIKDEEIKREIVVYDNVIAPVYKGDKLGELTITYDGDEIARIPLLATEAVNRSKPAETMAVAKSFTSSSEFRMALAIVILFAVGYTVIHIVIVQKKYMKKD